MKNESSQLQVHLIHMQSVHAKYAMTVVPEARDSDANEGHLVTQGLFMTQISILLRISNSMLESTRNLIITAHPFGASNLLCED